MFFFQVDTTDIESEEKRCELFLRLLESSHKPCEFQHLVLLLQAWPPMEMSSRWAFLQTKEALNFVAW